MTEQNWPDLVERYIVQGRTPILQSSWETEEPETYLERLYKQAGEPSALREALVHSLREALQKYNRAGLSRGLRLVTLIPHPDFAALLQELFFTIRFKEHFDEVGLLALRAMQVLQGQLPEKDRLRSVWQAMWLALLADPKYGIAAFHGLRYLDTSLALEYLPLLLRRSDLPIDDLKVTLRGLRRDCERAGIELTGKLSAMIASLTDEELINYQIALEDSFGKDVISSASRQANEETELSLEQDADLFNFGDGSPLRYLHDRLFPKLASWLKERLPTLGVSIWLVDGHKRQVHFRGQAGLPGKAPRPPRIFKFGEFAAGRVAVSRETEFVDLSDPKSPPVYMKDEFLDLRIKGLFSVFAEARPETRPSLSVVVNYFDETVERLKRLEQPCIRNSTVVVNLCERLLERYTNVWTGDLTDRLNEEPTLTETINTVVEDTSKAIPSCEQVAVYLFDASLRTLSLFTLYDTATKQHRSGVLSNGHSGNGHSAYFRVGEGLAGYMAERYSPFRDADLNQWHETDDTASGATPSQIHTSLERLGFTNLPQDRSLNYLGAPLREPAPSGFTGRLVGVIEMYRSVEKSEGRVFTPVGEHIFSELAKASTPFLLSAYRRERRFNQAPFLQQPYLFPSDPDADHLNAELDVAEQFFRKEVQALIGKWTITKQAQRSFFAFRTLREKCKAFWSTPPERSFDEIEKKARLELQRAILINDDLILAHETACAVTAKLLQDLNVSEAYREILTGLGLVLVPLADRRQLAGMIGLEFGSPSIASEAANTIVNQRKETQFVRTSVMSMWLDHRRHLETLFGAFLEGLSDEAVKDGKLDSKQHFFNFMGRGRSDLSPNEKSFSDLTAMALRTVPSDAKCSLEEECQNWQTFANRGSLHVEIEPIQLMALPSAIRMMLATSTAPVLWGGEAHISMVAPDDQPEWRYFRITVPRNGNEKIRKAGLSLAKGISEYRGWDCIDNGIEGLTVVLPAVPSVAITES